MSKNLLELLSQKATAGAILTITIDFSCLDKEEQPDMLILREWESQGSLEIKGAEEITKEYERIKSESVKEKLKEQLTKTTKITLVDPAIYGRARWGRFRWGERGTMREERGIDFYFQEFQKVMFPSLNISNTTKNVNDYFDIMHIATHYILKRDIFLTRNTNHFMTEKLRERFEDLVVFTPQQCVCELKQIDKYKVQ